MPKACVCMYCVLATLSIFTERPSKTYGARRNAHEKKAGPCGTGLRDYRRKSLCFSPRD